MPRVPQRLLSCCLEHRCAPSSSELPGHRVPQRLLSCCLEHRCAPSSSELPSHRVPLRPLSCCLEHRVLRATGSRVTLKKEDVSALHHWDCDKCQPKSAGAILVGNRPPKSVFPHLAHVALSSLRLETANFAIYHHAPRTSFICGYIVSTSMTVFASTIAINAEQLANSPHLEPAF